MVSLSLGLASQDILSPKLRLLRYLHTYWDSYPAGTTFAGEGLSPAGITDFSQRTWTNTPGIVATNSGIHRLARCAARWTRILTLTPTVTSRIRFAEKRNVNYKNRTMG